MRTPDSWKDFNYFSYYEMTRSDTAARYGIDNTPPPALLNNGYRLTKLLDGFRHALGKPLNVNVAFRGKELNDKVGGVATSLHCKFCAADIECFNHLSTPELGYALLKYCKANGFLWDELILEYWEGKTVNGGWIHFGIVPDEDGEVAKREILQKNKGEYYKAITFDELGELAADGRAIREKI